MSELSMSLKAMKFSFSTKEEFHPESNAIAQQWIMQNFLKLQQLIIISLIKPAFLALLALDLHVLHVWVSIQGRYTFSHWISHTDMSHIEAVLVCLRNAASLKARLSSHTEYLHHMAHSGLLLIDVFLAGPVSCIRGKKTTWNTLWDDIPCLLSYVGHILSYWHTRSLKRNVMVSIGSCQKLEIPRTVYNQFCMFLILIMDKWIHVGHQNDSVSYTWQYMTQLYMKSVCKFRCTQLMFTYWTAWTWQPGKTVYILHSRSWFLQFSFNKSIQLWLLLLYHCTSLINRKVVILLVTCNSIKEYNSHASDHLWWVEGAGAQIGS